uniref:Uncharacterized protein n=1 Tax=Ditylenchus dipsaci TaxID=166011 RepID=A0A915D477_9BILA
MEASLIDRRTRLRILAALIIAVAGEQFGKFSSDVFILWVCNASGCKPIQSKVNFKAMLGLPEEATFDLEMMDDDAGINSSLATYENIKQKSG